MATTLDKIQQEIAANYEHTSNIPGSTDARYVQRLVLINRFERDWGRYRKLGSRWPQLFSVDTSISTVASTATVTLPSDFTLNGLALDTDGEVEIGGNGYLFIKRENKDKYADAERLTWITGNDAAGYTLTINPTPTTVMTVTIPYYTTNLATNAAGTGQEVLALGTDLTKCPNPMFLAYSTLSELYRNDREENQARRYESKAEDAWDEMVSNNFNANVNQMRQIPDVAEDEGYPNIGA